MSLRLSIAAVCVAFSTSAGAQIHGKTDAFAVPGVKLAWAVMRGADEAGTTVVIRVVADHHRVLSVVGRDPFSNAERVWMPPTRFPGRMDIRLGRSGFAEFPRTELRFLNTRERGAKPLLEVFYLGVPDTTPEFTDAARLDKYLDERIAKVPLE